MSTRLSRHGAIPTVPVLAIGVAVLLLGTPVRSEETALETIQTRIKSLEAQLKNTSVRLKYVTGGGVSRQTGELVPDKMEIVSPLLADCCASNVTVVKEDFKSIYESLKTLHAQHKRADDPQGMAAVSHMAEQFRGLNESFAMLGAARERKHAEVAMKAVASWFNLFRRSTKEYVECCGEQASTTEENS